jgi:hypothetical protein
MAMSFAMSTAFEPGFLAERCGGVVNFFLNLFLHIRHMEEGLAEHWDRATGHFVEKSIADRVRQVTPTATEQQRASVQERLRAALSQVVSKGPGWNMRVIDYLLLRAMVLSVMASLTSTTKAHEQDVLARLWPLQIEGAPLGQMFVGIVVKDVYKALVEECIDKECTFHKVRKWGPKDVQEWYAIHGGDDDFSLVDYIEQLRQEATAKQMGVVMWFHFDFLQAQLRRLSQSIPPTTRAQVERDFCHLVMQMTGPRASERFSNQLAVNPYGPLLSHPFFVDFDSPQQQQSLPRFSYTDIIPPNIDQTPQSEIERRRRTVAILGSSFGQRWAQSELWLDTETGEAMFEKCERGHKFREVTKLIDWLDYGFDRERHWSPCPACLSAN